MLLTEKNQKKKLEEAAFKMMLTNTRNLMKEITGKGELEDKMVAFLLLLSTERLYEDTFQFDKDCQLTYSEYRKIFASVFA